MKKIISLMLSILLITITPLNVSANFTNQENINAMLIGNPEDGSIYFSEGVDEVFPIASISKIMTYLVVMDNIKAGNISLEDDVTISQEAAKLATPGYANFGLKQDEVIKVSDLLKGLMVVSGNDAAVALAEHVAGTEAEFTKLMNEKAQELGLVNSKFVNSSGLTVADEESTRIEENEDGEQVQIQTLVYNEMPANELFKLASHIVNTYPEVEEYGKMTRLSYPDRNYENVSTLPLQDDPTMVGLKTGYTSEAGYSFVGLFDRSIAEEDKDYKIITILLGADTSEQRALNTKELINYFNNNYIYTNLVNKNTPYMNYYDDKTAERSIALYPESDLSKLTNDTSRFSISHEIDESKDAPFQEGEVLGQLIVKEDDVEIDRINLVTHKQYARIGFVDNLLISIQEFFENLLLLF